MNKHTALPWHTNLRSHPSDQVFSGDDIVADCKWTMHTHDIREANAAFIVQACNAHDDLVAALEAASKGYQGMFDAMPVAWQTYANIIDEALAKARGEA